MFASRKDGEEAQEQLQQLSQHIDFYHPKIAEIKGIKAQFLANEKECLAAIEGFLSEFKPLALAQSEASRKLHEAKALDSQIKNDEKKLWVLNNLFNPTQEKFSEENYKKIAQLLRDESDQYQRILGDEYVTILTIASTHADETDKSLLTKTLSNIHLLNPWYYLSQPDHLKCSDAIVRVLNNLQKRKPENFESELSEANKAVIQYGKDEKITQEYKKMDAAQKKKEASLKELYQSLSQYTLAHQLIDEDEQKDETDDDHYAKKLILLEKNFVSRKKLYLNKELIASKNVLDQIEQKITSFDLPQDQKSASALDLIRQQKTAILAQKKYLQAALVAVRDLFKLIDPIKILQLRLDQAFQEEFFQYEALVQQSKKLSEILLKEISTIAKKLLVIAENECKEYDRILAEQEYKLALQQYRRGELADTYGEVESQFYSTAEEELKTSAEQIANLEAELKDELDSKAIKEQVQQTKSKLLEKQTEWQSFAPQFQQFAPKRYLVKKKKDVLFTQEELKTQLNGKDFSDIELNDMIFRCLKAESTSVMTDVNFSNAQFHRCRFVLGLNNVRFQGAYIATSTFATYKGTLFDAKTEWNKVDAAKILLNHLTDPLYKPQDEKEDYLPKLIELVHAKNNTVISPALILSLIQQVGGYPIPCSRQNLTEKRLRSQLIITKMLDKIVRLDDLAKLSALFTSQEFQFLRGKDFFNYNQFFKDIVAAIQNRVNVLITTEQNRLSVQNQNQLNIIMNFDRSSMAHLFYRKDNVGVRLFTHQLKTMDVKEGNATQKKIMQFKTHAALYDAQSLDQPKGTDLVTFHKTMGDEYREKLFVEAFHLLSNDQLTIEQMTEIQKTIRGTRITHLGAGVEFGSNRAKYRPFQDKQKILEGLIKDHLVWSRVIELYEDHNETVSAKVEKLLPEIWGINVPGSENPYHDPRDLGTTRGGLLMDLICEQLIQYKKNSLTKYPDLLTKSLKQLRSLYSNLKKTRLHEESPEEPGIFNCFSRC